MEPELHTWALALTAISAICAAAAALASLLQARRSAQGNEVNVYLTLMREYGSKEMRESIAELARFRRERDGQAIADALVNELSLNPKRASELKGHARALSAFFVNAARLHEGNFISRKLLVSLISRPGLNVFYEVAVPINLAKNPRHTSGDYVAALKKVVPGHGGGIY
jgi:hypothetical protein